MPKRSVGATLSQILVEFGRDHTLSQAELAKRCGVEVRAVKRNLVELQAAGVPLVRDEDPPHVYWSVPRSWRGGMVSLATDDVLLVARLIGRLPASTTKRAAMKILAEGLRKKPVDDVSDALGLDAVDDAQLVVVEDSLASKQALRMEYASTRRGVREWRTVSVHHLAPEGPARFVATCHRDDTLKWFRVDHILRGHATTEEPFRHADPAAVERMVATSVNGFHGDGPLTEVSFRVREPESRWVESNHPKPLEVEKIQGGIRLRATVASPKQVARFVVSLGAAAQAETPELLDAVLALAEGTVRVNKPR